jgi:integrase
MAETKQRRPKGTGSVERVGPNKWRLVWDGPPISGKTRNQKKKTFVGNKAQAQAELNRLIEEAKSPNYVEPSKLSVEAFLAQWVKGYGEQNWEPTTYQTHERLIRNYIVPHIGSFPLEKLKATDLDQLYLTLQESGRRRREGGIGVRTVQEVHDILTRALRWGVKKKLVRHNAAEDADRPKGRAKEADALNVDQTRQLLETVKGTPLYIPVFLACWTGMRQGEIVALRWADVDLEVGTLTVRRSLQYIGRDVREGSAPGAAPALREKLSEVQGVVREKGTKTGEERTLPLPPSFVAELRRVREEQVRVLGEPAEWVAATPDGKQRSPSALSTAFYQFKKKHGFPVHFHSLRHGVASHLGAAAVHPEVAAKLLGHKHWRMTAHYTHAQEREMRKAVNQLEALLGGLDSQPPQEVRTAIVTG